MKAGVTLSDAITEIPEEAFAYCGNLHEIKLPAKFKRIGYRAFCGSPHIGSFGGLKIPLKVYRIRTPVSKMQQASMANEAGFVGE